FMWHLLNDVQALEYMLNNDWFESDVIRIGAEQEMCLVDNETFKPATINLQVLELMKEHEWCGTELAKFNLETNLSPRVFKGKCLSEMEEENTRYLSIIRNVLNQFNSSIILTGILPTLRKYDLELTNLTPKDRYFALMESINNQLFGNAYELRLTGIDELLVKHDSPLLEACNTSFQVHLQVAPKDFARLYNISQTLAAPVLGISANSPIVFGRRLWHETRIALFQQALDTRTTHDHMRERSPRVHFGKTWLKDSILEIYKEDIARFRVLLGGEIEENSIEAIRSGRSPKLKALQIHNSTVYRWNRPCYGISENGKPHLRIENRVLPAGPTVVDEMANAAFWLGCMVGMGEEYKDITKHISYADIRDNFGKAARYGIDSTFTWLKDKKIGAKELVWKELLPIARAGLEKQKVDKKDIDKYLGIIEERAEAHTNGARWMLRAFTKLKDEVGLEEANTVMTSAIVFNQSKGIPVHKWKLPEPTDLESYTPSKLKVEEFMETDLFTVQKDDLVELVAELMDWRKIRYMPVEDSKGNLVGLVTSRLLLRHFTRHDVDGGQQPKQATVKDLMIAKPYTTSPDATIMEAMNIMREKKIGCLPVVQGKELVGVITEMDFLRITGRLMDRLEK
ncbi:MAG: CBS domain-containing protein, partial [Saprospiraceae bacterium]